MRGLGLLFLAAFFIPAPLSAQDEAIVYFGFPEQDACFNWTETRQAAEKRDVRAEMLEAWVMGFVTSHNFYAENDGATGISVTTNSLFRWMDTYCAEHPFDHLITAAAKLVEALETKENP